MRLSNLAQNILAAAAIVFLWSSASHAVSFWLSHDAEDGSFGDIDLGDGHLNETVEVFPGEPVELTIWATLEGVADLTVISLGLDAGSTASLTPNAVWIFNTELNVANTYRHQITLASNPTEFVSANLPPAEDDAFPFCNQQGCRYANLDPVPDNDQFYFGGVSIGEPVPEDDGSEREGVGVGNMAKMRGDVHFVPAEGGVPELWRIGVIEFLSIAGGTTTLNLFEGDAVGSGSGPAWNFYSLDLTVEFASTDADADSDGDVDGRDFLSIQEKQPQLISLWEEYYGSGVIGAARVVPELTSLSIQIIALATAWYSRRDRRAIL